MGFLEKIFNGKIAGFLQEVVKIAKELAQGLKQKFFDIFPDAKHRIIIGAGAAAFFVIIIMIVMLNKETGRDKPEADDSFTRPHASGKATPIEEFFLPDEPDFVPGVILERNRRDSWNEDDAWEYWQDPLRYGEEQWRGKIEAVIDDYLERVP